MTRRLARHLPVLDWGRRYTRETLANDLIAAMIVTIMLIPQSLAYAMLAGLPPEVGLYASMLPLVAYALFGTSHALAVGPVAVVSLMTATAAGNIAAAGSPDYVAAALALALLSGLMLLLMGVFRLGFLANFLSRPVVSGFITATGLIIAASQLKHLLGVSASGHTLLEITPSLAAAISSTHVPTLLIGAASLAFLFWVRAGFKGVLLRLGVQERVAGLIARCGPILAVAAGVLATASLNLNGQGVKIVGEIPAGLPAFGFAPLDPQLLTSLVGSAALISLIGFVESASVAQTLADKHRRRIDPNQELIGLGAANVAAGATGGYPVTGGFARSAVNFEAGAATPAAGAFTAIGVGVAALFLTPYLYFLPQAVLAATIIVAVLSLINIRDIGKVWAYSKDDFAAMAATILITLAAGVEFGVATGVALSIFLHLYKTSRPHFAIVGQVPGTHHFRNVDRHAVVTSECLLTIRLDESLYFANARFLEDAVYRALGTSPELKHVVLMCSAVNQIDASGLASLEAINLRLKKAGVALHLSEVKGPVMDSVKRTDFLERLSGAVYLHQYEAVLHLDADCALAAVERTDAATNPRVAGDVERTGESG